MSEFIDGDTKKRHEIADHMIDLCANLLDNPEIQDATNGLAKEARSLLDLLYLPNERHGEYHVSGKKYEGHGIPLIVTTPGKRVRVKRLAKHVLHPLQQERLPGVLDDHNIDTSDTSYDDILDYIRRRYDELEGSKFKSPKDDNSWIACVYAPGSELRMRTNGGKRKKLYTVESSPVLFMQSALPELDDSGDLLFHELVHVQQALTKIIYRTRDMDEIVQRYELEAYSYEAIAQSIHYGEDMTENPTKWRAMDIENVRRRVNTDSDDPYRISKELIAGLKQLNRWPL